MKHEPTTTTQPPITPERILLWLSLLFTAFVLFENTLLLYGRDQSIYAVVANAMLDGGAPYKDAWDFKPPGIYFIYALARLLFGSGMHAIRILESLCLLSLVLAFALFSRRHFGSATAGVLGGALTLLVHTQFDWWQTAQPESFGAVFLAWALVCATTVPAPGAARRGCKHTAAWTGAGALYTFAALLKPPLGGGFVVSLALLIWYRWRHSDDAGRGRDTLAIAACFFAGAVAVLLSVAAYFMATGAMGDLHQALFVFAPHYTAVTAADTSFPSQLLKVFRFWLLSHSFAGTLGLLLVLILPRAGAREREGLLHAAGILLTQVIGVALQSKFFAYHFGAIFPFTGLLAAWGYWKLLRIRAVRWALPLLLITLCALQLITKGAAERSSIRIRALLDRGARETLHDSLYSIRTYNAAEIRNTARYIAAHTPTDTPIYIWGFLPVIYDLARRPPASRYIYNVPQRMEWDDGASRRTLMRELAQSPPAAIVVAVRDNFKAVTGNDLDSARELRRFTQLQQFIDARYTLSQQYGDLYIFLRNDPRE